MLYSVVVNNYALSVRVRMTPTHKLVKQTRFDRDHTELIYDLAHDKEAEYVGKLLAYKLNPVKD